MVTEEAKSFFLYNNLCPVMIPFLNFAGGNCQDALILVEELAVTEKLRGGFEGTKKWNMNTQKRLLTVNKIISKRKEERTKEEDTI